MSLSNSFRQVHDKRLSNIAQNIQANKLEREIEQAQLDDETLAKKSAAAKALAGMQSMLGLEN